MLWVGGGIVVHGLEVFGAPGIAHAVHHVAEAAGHAVPGFQGAVTWIIGAVLSGLIGIVIGAVTIPVVGRVVAPAWRALKRLRGS